VSSKEIRLKSYKFKTDWIADEFGLHFKAA